MRCSKCHKKKETYTVAPQVQLCKLCEVGFLIFFDNFVIGLHESLASPEYILTPLKSRQKKAMQLTGVTDKNLK